MKRIVTVSAHQVKIEEVPEGRIEAGQVKIKIHYCGICGSDLHAYTGNNLWALKHFPLAMGHEISGVITEMASDVSGLHIGQPVTINPVTGCGKCKQCRSGNVQQCAGGGITTGGGAEYMIVPSSQVVPIPDDMDLQDTAMIEPLAVAVHAVARVPAGVAGKDIFICGAGTIGNLVGQVALALGANHVFISDLAQGRLDVAEKLGMCPINPAKMNIEQVICDKVGRRDIDVAFECVGNAKSVDSCLQIAERGGTVMVLGVFGGAVNADLFQVQDKELNVLGSIVYRPEDFLKARDMAYKKEVNLGALRSKTFTIDEIESAFHYLEDFPDKCIKAMIKIAQ